MLIEAAKCGDFGTLREIGHRLKGEGSGYGFERITQLGGALEQAAMRADRGEVSELIAALREYLESIELHFD